MKQKRERISKGVFSRFGLTFALVAAGSLTAGNAFAQIPTQEKYVFESTANPYLPLWEHLPDGEPRVFEDPDNPGKYRIYIIGSHDVRLDSYCGPDIHAWSAPAEDLSQWRDEGSLFKYYISGQWDVMYAPDLVEVKGKDGKKTYYLYPHSRGWKRVGMVCKSDRPDGPFTPVNLNEDGTALLDGSIIDFDPSVFVDKVTDKKDKDYSIGFRAYAFWGYQRSTAMELDQNTMYSMRPGTQLRDYFLPASARYGVIRDPEGTKYPALYSEQNPGEFNFYEASSIRKVGNKYVMVFSGYSGPDYGLGSTNSALRYAFGDSPLGPWRSGGVLVDSRGVVPNEDGSKLITTNSAHNTHGSLQEINGQWYVFYHRPPRGFGNARQAAVAPVIIECDSKKVADGGIVKITAYDPYAKDGKWTAKASDGNEYTGAEVTSEGFHIFGLDPYRYYSAGYACYMSNPGWMQDTWDVWDNNMDLTGVNNGGIIGFKYFGFGGLAKNSKGIKAFEGAKKGNQTAINLFLTPCTDKAFTIKVMLDGPYANTTWNGKQIATISVPANSSKVSTKFTADVASAVEGLKGKHAIYLIAEGEGNEPLFNLHGIGFSSKNKAIDRFIAPTVKIEVNGKNMAIPATPIHSTEQNGFCSATNYEIKCTVNANEPLIVKANASDPGVKTEVKYGVDGYAAAVVCTYKSQTKTYYITRENAIDESYGYKDTYKNYFDIGVAINMGNLDDPTQVAMILRNFTSITAENDMKAISVHPSEGVWNWTNADRIADFCRKNGLKLRGHNLCWHAQFCDWMFTDKDGKDVSKEVFYKRLREHIHTVVNRYKDIVHVWDVVNEAISDGGDNPYRQSRLYKLCGDEFIAKAFQYAHEADPKAVLFYNDYNAADPVKRDKIYNMVKKMQDAGVPITGIGMQGHYNIYGPSAKDVDAAIEKYSTLVKHIHMTELDIRVNREMGGQLQFDRGNGNVITDQKKKMQEEAYANLFATLRKHKDAVECVTFWNLSDKDTWLGTNNYPLPFGADLKPKKVYSIIRDFK